MSSWRDKLRQASFRGIPFEIEDHGIESGRRSHLHEYPNKDIPYMEDMGKKAETFSFNAYVIGDDYISKRDALKEACCDILGPGTLVHPTIGNIEVVCTGCSISEKSSEGRMARFALTFTESGEQSFPSESVNYKDKISALSDTLEDRATDNFTSRFSVTGKTTSVADSIAEVAKTFSGKALKSLEIANSQAGDANIFNSGVSSIDAITSVANSMSSLSANALNILSTPDVFVSLASEAFTTLNKFLEPKTALKQTISVSDLGVPALTDKINPDTPKGSDQIEMMQQIEVFTQRLSLANQAKTISSIEFTNSNEAEAFLNDFLEQVEYQELLEIPTNDDVLQTLKDLRAALVKDISYSAKKLPEITAVRVSENTPSVVLAYDLYEDIGRASEIIGRNNIRHPGFIPVGKDIEVLSK